MDPIEITPHARLQAALTRLRREFPDNDARWIAERALAHLKASDLRTVVMHYAVADVWQAKRAEARRVEQNAYQRATYVPKATREALVAEPRVTLGQAMVNFQATIRDELRLDLTAELMATTFAVGDGRMTTWGRATVDEHRQRAAVLIGQGLGTLQTAALHEAAIEMIEAGGAVCLAEVKVAA